MDEQKTPIYKTDHFRKHYAAFNNYKVEQCKSCWKKVFYGPFDGNRQTPYNYYDMVIYASCLWGEDHRLCCPGRAAVEKK